MTTTTPTTPQESVEDVIRRFFEENFEQLRLESGRSLSPEVKEAAWQQVRLYWMKLRDVATKITDTEVKLNLPGQETSKGRKFGIEGVVDIVREEGRTTMYDIKTHELDTIRGNLSLYEQQLNVYAHIWRHLRRQELDETAIISTSFPRAVKEALSSDIPGHLEFELERWDPIVCIPFSEERLEETIRHFGEIVDAIEDGEFDPAPVEKLQSRLAGAKANFATQVCINCDARYSCDSFRAYAQQSGRRVAEATFAYLADTASDIELTDRLVASLDAAPPVASLE
jgi:hypothetical protein